MTSKLWMLGIMAMSTPALAAPTAFVDVTVVTGERPRALAHQTVLVEEGRITAVGPAAKMKLPPGATEIAGSGKFLMPGLTEMHGHLPGGNLPTDVAESWLTLFAAAGVTTVRGMQGAPNQFALRERIGRGELLGPALVLYSPMLGGGELKTPEAAAARVREHKQTGYDGLKIGEGLSPAVYDAIVATAKEVGLPFAGHVPNEVGVARAIAAGQKTIEHLEGFVEALASGASTATPMTVAPDSKVAIDTLDFGKLPPLVTALKKADAFVVPTMAVWRTLFADAPIEELRQRRGLAYMLPNMVASWEKGEIEAEAKAAPIEQRRKLTRARDRILAAIARAGGRIALGADAPQVYSVPGFSLEPEAVAMVAAGMTPAQVIESGTTAAARALGRAGEVGQVAVGQRADLILTEANPLSDVRNIFRSAGVMLAGRWLPRTEIDRRLGAIAQGNQYPTDAEIKDVALRPEEKTAVLGKYALPTPKVTLAVYEDQGKLMVRDLARQDAHVLRPQGNGTFLVPSLKARVRFEPPTGKAGNIVWGFAGAKEMKGPRTD